MKVVVAIDSFKGCLTSKEANQAAAEGILIAGRISDKEELLKAGFAQVECINPEGITLEEAMRKEVAMRNISNTVKRFISCR